LLLVASCIFYAYFIPAYILILFITIVIDYTAGILIDREQGKKRKLYLVISIIANVGFLAIFKYYNFFIENTNRFFHGMHAGWHDWPYLNLILPIGLSFHTFQSMSYTIEVYRRKQQPEQHFGIYALYVMYYPQLVAGPIERPQNMLHQFREKQSFDYKRVTDGLKIMAWGMFKKVVIADSLAVVVSQFYHAPQNYSSLSAIFAIICFSFQIYCDFSGYSDIAIGSSKVMGIQLMRNFRQPYLSRSFSEFWQRWHISLSSWFRDYVYIPLGGNRKGTFRKYLNIMIVFLLSGLWHGANWTFVVWGGLHGFFLVLSGVSDKKKVTSGKHLLKKVSSLGKIGLIFFFVSIAWIFFRSSSVNQAWHIMGIAGGDGHVASSLKNTLLAYNITPRKMLYLIAVVLLLLGVDLVQEKTDIVQFINSKPLVARWSCYFCIIFITIFFGVWGNQQFIYFQF